jgi:hypothetical protein
MRTTEHSSAQVAVVDAMMATQCRVIQRNPVFAEARATNSFNADVETILEKDSRDRCFEGSSYALLYLYQNHKDLFQRFILFGGVKPPFSSFSWREHYYFLVQDKKGVWYAGSPANYHLGVPHYKEDDELYKEYLQLLSKDIMMTVLSSPHLEDIIRDVQSSFAGRWPSAEFLQRRIAKRYKDPSLRRRSRTGIFQWRVQVAYAPYIKHPSGRRGKPRYDYSKEIVEWG